MSSKGAFCPKLFYASNLGQVYFWLELPGIQHCGLNLLWNQPKICKEQLKSLTEPGLDLNFPESSSQKKELVSSGKGISIYKILFYFLKNKTKQRKQERNSKDNCVAYLTLVHLALKATSKCRLNVPTNITVRKQCILVIVAPNTKGLRKGLTIF